MPRWRPLPEELDPQIREFTSQLRRLVDRSGMSVATIADRTGYSKSSWERYLGGRLLPPRGATHALGDVTGTDIRHLETMWELAERAWSRDEMRHDQTMEAIRVAQAREALGEFWDDEPAKGRKWGRKEKNRTRNREKNRDKDGARGQEEAHSGGETAVKEEEWKEKTGEIPVFSENSQHRAASSGFLAPPSASSLPGARTGASAPSGSGNSPDSPDFAHSPTSSNPSDSSNSSTFSFFSPSASASAAQPETGRPPMDDETAVLRPRPLPGRGGRGADGGRGTKGGDGAGSAPGGFPAQRVDVSSWGAPVEHRSGAPAGTGGRPGPGRTEPVRTGTGPPAYPSNSEASHASRAAAGDGHGDPDAPDGVAAPHGHGRSSRGRRVAALLGGALAVFAVLGAGVMVFGLPGGAKDSSASPAPSATNKPPDLPAGVKCRGKSCSGKDPEKMGCGGQNVKSSNSAFVGPSRVEVRYSKVCQAAWGRITGAAQGDSLKISAKGQAESDKVDATNDAYTEMVSVSSATEARACATLVAGTTGCTKVNAAGQAGTDASTDAGADAGAGAEGTAETAGTTGTTGTVGRADTRDGATTSGTEETAGAGDAVP
ncbi:helix-turn-helix domain-containing protein [Streptomyces marispadix]|uniref:XRE family transcriptional regulator n=1 Tax=Streptomyces marispadix TaxID=2922868 RepID=A0ABS9T0V8_9ACTN|nr:XRE family transcriptional regulator [Streptomyces marispadix]MCH6162166.1 XRE family transcriptional regulator [Streptomyces marispadix]